jgi:hypothetical protein
MHSHGVKSLRLHPWNVWDSHGSDIVVVVILVAAREGLGEAPAPSVGIPCTSAMHLVRTTHPHHCLSTDAHQVHFLIRLSATGVMM